MNVIRPGDLVVIFKACLAQRTNSEEYVWIDRTNAPQLVLWVGIKCDPDTGESEVGVLMNTEKIKGVYVLPQSALVEA